MESTTDYAAQSAAGILSAAASRLSHEGAWTQGEDARDASGNRTDPLGPDAVSWSADGMLARVAGEWRFAQPAIDCLRGVIGTLTNAWNDAEERTQDEVVQALRTAAAQAQQKA